MTSHSCAPGALSCAQLRSVARLAGDAHQAQDDLAVVLARGVELGARLDVALGADERGVAVLAGGGGEGFGRHRARLGAAAQTRSS